MTGDDLPDENHVVHYVKPTLVRKDGKAGSDAFRLRKDEYGLSIHWLECFVGLAKPQQLDEVRRLSRLKIPKSGRFAELNVGTTKQHLKEQLSDIRFVHKPLNAISNHEADPSHSEIVGLPELDSPQGALIGDMIAKCVETMHLGLKES